MAPLMLTSVQDGGDRSLFTHRLLYLRGRASISHEAVIWAVSRNWLKALEEKMFFFLAGKRITVSRPLATPAATYRTSVLFGNRLQAIGQASAPVTTTTTARKTVSVGRS